MSQSASMTETAECMLIELYRAAVDELAAKGGGSGSIEFHVGPRVPGREPSVKVSREVVQKVRMLRRA